MKKKTTTEFEMNLTDEGRGKIQSSLITGQNAKKMLSAKFQDEFLSKKVRFIQVQKARIISCIRRK